MGNLSDKIEQATSVMQQALEHLGKYKNEEGKRL